MTRGLEHDRHFFGTVYRSRRRRTLCDRNQLKRIEQSVANVG